MLKSYLRMEKYIVGRQRQQDVVSTASPEDILARRGFEFERAVRSVNEGEATPETETYLLRKIKEGATVSFSPASVKKQRPFV